MMMWWLRPHRKFSLSSHSFGTARFFHNACSLLGRRVLLCGDGNLSNAASIAKSLQQEKTHLTATVLESHEEHNRVYKHSMDNIKQIQACHHDVCFQVDATRLETYNGIGDFDLIQFNFPHWKGKTNARHNRKLLENFFQSASCVVKRNGHVHVALMSHQGGAYANKLQEWKQSWMPARYAANHGLLLVRVDPFEPSYQLSSYRGEDRTFDISGTPQLYVFAAPDATDCFADEDVQMFCHFNLYLYHDDRDSAELYSEEKVQCRLQQHVLEKLPQGWRSQVLFVRIIQGKAGGWIGVLKVCFFGESKPIRQAEADHYRVLVQDSMVADKIPLLLRRHWAISNAYPSSILSSILQADRER